MISTIQKRPNLLRSHLLEWRAQKIHDPIEKLRYLRSAAAKGKASPGPRSIFPIRYWKAALLILTLVVLKIQAGPDTIDWPRLDSSAPKPFEQGMASSGPSSIWVVEHTSEVDVYSNGLRIENRYLTPTRPREYSIFDPNLSDRLVSDRRAEPVGIVFHTTESHLIPFEPELNDRLKRIGAGLLEFVRENRSYNFVIDRFGRAFRVVPESDSANHAGKSVWADERGLYVDLNESFIGVAFEAQMRPEENNSLASAAQIHTARVLVQMLLSKFRIPEENCVTHAQVSVNPGNMRIGYHTDWAAHFPFQELGLPDNYSQPLPSICAFGFECDPYFMNSAGQRLLKGLSLAEESVRREAEKQGRTVVQYKNILRQRYRETTAALKNLGALEEKKYETD